MLANAGRILAGGLSLLLALVAVSACSESSSSTPRLPTPTVPLEVQLESTPRLPKVQLESAPTQPVAAPTKATATTRPTDTPQPTPEPVIFEGKGVKVTPEFSVADGLLVFELHHDGTGAFAVKLFDKEASQNPSDIVSNKKGFDGTVAWSVNKGGLMTVKPGQYTLGVEATGNWKVTISQPKPASGKPIPLTLTGEGTVVTEPFELPQGPRTFELKNTTKATFSNFIVKLIKVDGSKEETIAVELTWSKPTEVSKVIGIKANEAGVYVLSVRAEGDWSVRIGD
ncbi:MAG: hypothetical protein HYX89_07230 [Chloroflexi bacterium]|nr:hypothetical protein [Chloroflexota bacterium]